MRRAALAILATVAFAACAQQGFPPAPFSVTWPCTAGSCTGTIGNLYDAGMPLGYVDSFRLAICAQSTFTLSGGGTLQDIWGSNLIGLPTRNAGNDQTLTAGNAGQQCASFPDFKVGQVSAEADFVQFVPSAVTVSGGTLITEYLYPHRGQ